MKSTTMFKPKSARNVLESLLEESIRTHEALEVAQAEVEKASDALWAFRTDNPGCHDAMSWTPIGKKRDQLVSNHRAAVRRRDQCHGSYDLATRHRMLIEQELQRY
jgi:hypothetical protein